MWVRCNCLNITKINPQDRNIFLVHEFVLNLYAELSNDKKKTFYIYKHTHPCLWRGFNVPKSFHACNFCTERNRVFRVVLAWHGTALTSQFHGADTWSCHRATWCIVPKPLKTFFFISLCFLSKKKDVPNLSINKSIDSTTTKWRIQHFLILCIPDTCGNNLVDGGLALSLVLIKRAWTSRVSNEWNERVFKPKFEKVEF